MKRLLVSGLLILALVPRAQAQSSFGDFIAATGLHKIVGYTTLGLVAATGAAGLLGSDLHPALGYATAAAAVLNVSLGAIAYVDLLPFVWPHALLNAAATTAFVLNAFVLEPGSLPHRISGATGALLMAAAYGAILIIMG